MPIVVSGPRAAIRWGYRRVAELGAWTFEAPIVRAEIIAADPVALTQSGLEFEIEQPGRPPTRRPVTWIRQTGGAVQLRLGPRSEQTTHADPTA